MENMQNLDKSGYYKVLVAHEGTKLPYTVFALSDYHAARLINQAIGYLPTQNDVLGPYSNA